jgi:D-sedoheptulose 7-phosphate isomerase
MVNANSKSTEATYHSRLLKTLRDNLEEINRGTRIIAENLLACHNSRGNVWLIGNGGSASTAEHFETDLSFLRQKKENAFLNVTALSSNSSLITAASNDISFELVYKTILEKKAKEGDLLISISASGNSPNILESISFAKTIGVKTMSLLGFDGGPAALMSDETILVRTQIGDYGITEDIHLSICHASSALFFEFIDTLRDRNLL